MTLSVACSGRRNRVGSAAYAARISLSRGSGAEVKSFHWSEMKSRVARVSVRSSSARMAASSGLVSRSICSLALRAASASFTCVIAAA